MKLNTLLRWPRTLFARLALILFVSLALVQTLSVWLTMTERDQTMTNVIAIPEVSLRNGAWHRFIVMVQCHQSV